MGIFAKSDPVLSVKEQKSVQFDEPTTLRGLIKRLEQAAEEIGPDEPVDFDWPLPCRLNFYGDTTPRSTIVTITHKSKVRYV